MTGRPARLRALTPRTWAVQLLGLVAGYADVAAYLGLGRVFAANMTGNTVLLGIGLVGWASDRPLLPQAPVRPGVALAAFAVGVMAAALPLHRLPWRIGYRLVLLLEAALLAGAAVGWMASGPRPATPYAWGLLGALAATMGVQSALANRVGIAGVPTTVVTSALVVALVRTVDRREPRIPALAWAVYLAGGAAGAAGTVLLGTAVLWPAPVLLLALAATASENADVPPAR